MLEEFKQAVAAEKLPIDRVDLPLVPLPKVEDPYPRMTFALLYDGLRRYIEEETTLILHPDLASGVLSWLNDLMPLPSHDLSMLFARVDTGDERVRAVMRRYKQLYIEHNRIAQMHNDAELPALLKITARQNFLSAACLFLVTMSTTLYQIREGIDVLAD